MFTGIIQDIGFIYSIQKFSSSLRISIVSKLPISRFELGASIACNGCCLTIVDFKALENGNVLFDVDIGPESLNLTQFSTLSEGDMLNLELALKLGDSLGGHQFTGHIDALCKVIHWNVLEDAFWKLRIQIPSQFCENVVPKGSIAIAGVSLTIAHIFKLPEEDSCIVEIMVIPHTFENTTLKNFVHGLSVEVEFDPMIKAIASLLKNVLPNYIQARK